MPQYEITVPDVLVDRGQMDMAVEKFRSRGARIIRAIPGRVWVEASPQTMDLIDGLVETYDYRQVGP